MTDTSLQTPIDKLVAAPTKQGHFSAHVLEAVLEHMAQGVCMVDPEFKVRFWNHRYENMFEMPPGFLYAGRPFRDVIAHFADLGEYGDRDKEEVIQERMAPMLGGSPLQDERERPNGIWVKIECSPVPGGGYVFTYTDISENKKIENQLRESERSIRFYSDNVPSYIAFIDKDEILRFCNKAYAEAFGHLSEDLADKPIKIFMKPADYKLRKPHIDAVLKGEPQEFMAVLRSESDGARDVEVYYWPQYDEGLSVRGYFAVYQDVTARMSAERELQKINETLEARVVERTRELQETALELEQATTNAEQATASKTRFLAAASHDLRQPLNAARLFASALEEELEGHPGALELVRNIDQSIESADRLLKALLDISRLDSGGVKPIISIFPIQELLDEVTNEFEVQARKKKIIFKAMPSSLHVRSDRGLLLSVLQNLASNAVRYTEKGHIVLGCRRRGNELRLEVWDTGLGIPKDKQTYVFEEFRRLERDRDRAPGFGLGLAIVERILRLLNHRLTLNSNLGRGTVFRVWVPIAKALPAKPAPQRRSRAQLQGVRVLAIDNEPQILKGLEALLTRWGCKISVAENAAEAFKHAPDAASAPQILLLDYHLDGGVTGLEVYENLTRAWGIMPPAILISADPSRRITALAESVDALVLRKPVEPAALRAAMGQLLRAANE